MTRRFLIGSALLFLGLFLVVPLVTVFVQGAKALGSLADPEATAAIRLTILVAVISVPLNTAFGIIAAWAVARFEFPGRGLLVALIDLPLTVSPVISGMVFVLLFGTHGALAGLGWPVLFAVPGLVLATTFVTFPYVARVLIPLMQAQGPGEEIAARTLGAGGWQIFWRVTVPNIKWGLFYAIVTCTARAIGEFGAVSVVSGHIRGKTTTAPLYIEMLYAEFKSAEAFAVASLLALIALATLAGRAILSRRTS